MPPPEPNDPTKFIDLDLLERKLLVGPEEEEEKDNPMFGIDVDELERKLLSKEARTQLRGGEQPVPYDQYSEVKDARRIIRGGTQLSGDTWKPIADKPLSKDTKSRSLRRSMRDIRYRDLSTAMSLEKILELRKKMAQGFAIEGGGGLSKEEAEQLESLTQEDIARRKLSERRRERRTEEEGGWQRAQDITKAVKKTATGEYAFEALGLTPELSEEYAREGGKMTGWMIGTKKGLELAAKLPDARMKALAIVSGGVVGGILGAAPADPLRPMTVGEMYELGTYSAGTGSMLYQLPAKTLIPRVLIGGSEAALITEIAAQGRAALDGGEPLPMEVKQFLKRQVVPFLFGGAAMGAIGPKPKLTGFDVSSVNKARNDVISLYEKRIAHHQKLQRARKGGKKKRQKEIIKTLKADLDAIHKNPSVFLDVSKPELMGRLAVMLRQREQVLKLAKSDQAEANRIAFNESMHYLNSMGRKDALSSLEALVKRDDLIPKFVKEGDETTFGVFDKDFRIDPAGVTETKGIITRDIGEGISPWTIRKDGEWFPAWRGYGPSSRGGIIPFARMHLGVADVLEEAGRLSKSKNPLAIEASTRIKNSPIDGDQYSGIAKGKLLRKAEKLGFNRIGKSKETELAMKEFAEYQKMRYLDDMQDVKGDIPTKMEYAGGKAVTSRVKRAPNFYESMSPMGKALIDGWGDSSGWFGKEMRGLKVKVVDANGKVRDFHSPEWYWPIRLKAVYEQALKNPTSKAPHMREAIEEMHTVFGTKSVDELKKRLAGLGPEDLTAIDKKTGEIKFEDHLGGMFNHLEKGRNIKGLPPEAVKLLDFELSLGEMYLSRGGSRLGEIKNFNQPFVAGADGRPVSNPDYMWNVLKTHSADDITNHYIKDAEKALFDPAKNRWEWANRATTAAMIANQKSAIKNLTGILKPWLFTRTPQYAEGVVRGLVDQAQDLAYSMRLIGSKSRTAELAEDIQAVGKDIADRVQLLQSKEVADTMGRVDKSKIGKLWQKGTGGRDITGGLLNVSGFRPAEDFTRKLTVSIAEVNRRAIMRQIDKAPDASRIMELRLALERSGGNPVERMKIEGELADLIGKPKQQGGSDLGFLPEPRTVTRKPDEIAQNARFDEVARFAARNDINLLKIRDEGIAQRSREKSFIPEEHPETLKWYQAYNREAQGGYRVDQLPLFMQDPQNKVLFKFMNWSQQMQRTFDRHVLEEARKEGNYRPLFKWLATTQIAGETLNPVLSTFFGRERSDAEWKEIGKAFEKDEGGKALQMLVFRAANNAHLSGMWDMWGSMVGSPALRLVERGRLDPVSDVAALQELAMLQEGLQRWHDSGYEAKTSFEVARALSLANQTANIVGVLSDDKVKRYQGKLMPRLRKLQHEFLEKKRSYGAEIQFDESTPMKRDLKAALFSGDADKAASIYSKFLQDKIDSDEYIVAQKPELRKKLQRVVRQEQPIKAGSAYSKKRVDDFVEFLDGTGWGGLEELKSLHNSYIKTAIDAGILDPEKGEGELDKPIAEGRRLNIYNDAVADKFFAVNKNLPSKEYETKLMTKFGVHRLEPFSGDSVSEAVKRIEGEDIISYAKSLYLNKGREDVAAQVLLNKDYRKIPNESVRAKFMWDSWKKQEIPNNRIRSFMDKLKEFNLISTEEVQILLKEIIRDDSLRRNQK